MTIDEVQFNVELSEILDDLVNALGQTELFSRGFKDSGDNIIVLIPLCNPLQLRINITPSGYVPTKTRYDYESMDM